MVLNLGLEFICFFVVFCVLCRGEDDYGTWHRTLAPFQAHSCDEEELILRCTSETLISVHYVKYGRQENSGHLCPGSRAFHTGNCDSSQNALKVIHEKCHKHRMCRLYITPDMFGRDPCPGVRKFVEVIYKCRPEDFANKIVCEGGQLNLNCPFGRGLTIYSASYGATRSGAAECRQPEGARTEDCLIEHADETMRSLCSGKQNCSLRADDRTFGNPSCAGTKYLKVAYNCMEKDLLLTSVRRAADDTIHTTSFPAWARGIDQSAGRNFGLHGMKYPTESSKLEMQSDEVVTVEEKDALSGDKELVGFMSQWMSAHKYMKGNKEKLILYVSISLVVAFLMFITVIVGRFVVTRLETSHSSKDFVMTPATEDQFFSDSDLEQYEPPEELLQPLPTCSSYITGTMNRKDSDILPRAPINTGAELNHYFS